MKNHGHMSPFNLLVGVALSAQPTDNCGNLAVWPGGSLAAAVAPEPCLTPSTRINCRLPLCTHLGALLDQTLDSLTQARTRRSTKRCVPRARRTRTRICHRLDLTSMTKRGGAPLSPNSEVLSRPLPTTGIALPPHCKQSSSNFRCRHLSWSGHNAVQLHLQPGDAVLVHQKVAHRISPNYSPHIRYQIYYRLSHAEHRAVAPLGDVWEHFEGLSLQE